ncbi:8484_t:CDS:2 [Gigaspora margarita]|uniref:8484_t:CDS:1 n=1 Tax=Gigaspora margarita TaxID=4874 RepID=A0ABN7V8C3_GIGMA|nr:8484_t:CDS:2 [Gigaspora margarita]
MPKKKLDDEYEVDSKPKTKGRSKKKATKVNDSDEISHDSASVDKHQNKKDKKPKKHKDSSSDEDKKDKKSKKQQDSTSDEDKKDKKSKKHQDSTSDENKKENKSKKHQDSNDDEDKKAKKSPPLTVAEKEANAEEADAILKKVPLPSKNHKVNNKNSCIIGAINIQAFGAKKSANEAVMKIIVDILQHFDIILCQEIHAPKDNEKIIEDLVASISTSSTPYSYVLSEPIGRNSYQERYLYLYRKNNWRVVDKYVIDDTKLGDKFIREPYVARFQHLKHSDVGITLVGCHTQPEKAYEEIQALVTNVYPIVKKNLEKRSRDIDIGQPEKKKEEPLSRLNLWLRSLLCCFSSSKKTSYGKTREVDSESSEPIVMMGDYNASGSYLNKKERGVLDELLEKRNLLWGISHESDTTVAVGDSAYDRFIFEQSNKDKWIGNTRVWKFDDGWADSIKEDPVQVKKAAKRVTDHYPIEFDLKLK